VLVVNVTLVHVIAKKRIVANVVLVRKELVNIPRKQTSPHVATVVSVKILHAIVQSNPAVNVVPARLVPVSVERKQKILRVVLVVNVTMVNVFAPKSVATAVLAHLATVSVERRMTILHVVLVVNVTLVHVIAKKRIAASVVLVRKELANTPRKQISPHVVTVASVKMRSVVRSLVASAVPALLVLASTTRKKTTLLVVLVVNVTMVNATVQKRVVVGAVPVRKELVNVPKKLRNPHAVRVAEKLSVVQYINKY